MSLKRYTVLLDASSYINYLDGDKDKFTGHIVNTITGLGYIICNLYDYAWKLNAIEKSKDNKDYMEMALHKYFMSSDIVSGINDGVYVDIKYLGNLVEVNISFDKDLRYAKI